VVIRDPYISGVERFEAPIAALPYRQKPHLLQRQTAHFCLLAWQAFASDLRRLRYSISYDHQPDNIVEFLRMPHLEELSSFDLGQASQIDLEFISQHPAAPNKQKPLYPTAEDYFPAFLEVFIPLAPPQPEQSTTHHQHNKDCLVIWCRPAVVQQVLDLWGRAADLALAPA
jgi:hypothetical protein